jgi:hypothetical protein
MGEKTLHPILAAWFAPLFFGAARDHARSTGVENLESTIPGRPERKSFKSPRRITTGV